MEGSGFSFQSLFSSLAILGVTLTFSLTLVSIGIPNGGTVAQAFEKYQTLMPGQAVSDLAQLGCQPPQHRPGQDSNRVLCHLFPEDGPFHLITLVLYHRVIGEVSFYSETLQLGELIADWQEYDSSRRSPSGQIVTLSWDRADYRISAVVSLLSRQPHVQLVTLTATDGIVPT